MRLRRDMDSTSSFAVEKLFALRAFLHSQFFTFIFWKTSGLHFKSEEMWDKFRHWLSLTELWSMYNSAIVSSF